jgi:Leucine-rich repeat (LRR) protein
MFRLKFLLVSCLIFNLSEWIDGKTLNCTLEKNNRESCYCQDAKLSNSEEASFGVTNLESGETPANIPQLYFSSSSIYYVPASIFTFFTKLKGFQIFLSKVQEIRNNTFENATDLRYIDLSWNKISALEADTFRGATSLGAINLYYNQISHIDPNAFRGLPNLSYLKLGFNKITELDSRTFAMLNKVFLLDLSRNSIKALDKDTFRNLQNLVDLDLSNNLLETLDDTLFVKNLRLSALILGSNQIRALNSKMFKHLIYLYLDLRDNVCVDTVIRSRFEDPNQENPEILLAKCDNNSVSERPGRICHRILKN